MFFIKVPHKVDGIRHQNTYILNAISCNINTLGMMNGELIIEKMVG
jgi:hypothetical protein